MANILVIDDQDRYIELCRRAIAEHTYLGPARSWADALDLLRQHHRNVDLVLLDVHFDLPADQLVGLPPNPEERHLVRARRRQGLEILARLRRLLPDLPVILMTAREDLALERAAEQLDAEDYTYFLDDEYVDARSLRLQIENILQSRSGRESEGPIYWGRSAVMRRARARLAVLARGRLPIILGGETGTGKSMFARHWIHPRSGRKGKFVTVDLSTLPRDLMSAHLFGSVKGAYTGSVADRRGAFEEADGGTLFLDEIGNLSEDAQKMLLGVLQDGIVRRLGDVVERQVDVKVIVATHADLGAMVRAGKFRADLYMRLNPACTVIMPRLGDRRGDLMGLLKWSAERVLEGPALSGLVKEYRRRAILGETGPLSVVLTEEIPPAEAGTLRILFSGRTLKLLRQHYWPGNLREFSMVVENALTFTFTELNGLPPSARADVVVVRPKVVRDLLRAVQQVTDDGGAAISVNLQPGENISDVMRDVERQILQHLYRRDGQSFSRMAQVLLGDDKQARKVQLRFNQIGLKVRDMR